jgi:hypothetical protein
VLPSLLWRNSARATATTDGDFAVALACDVRSFEQFRAQFDRRPFRSSA